jgi:hypothetical protein
MRISLATWPQHGCLRLARARSFLNTVTSNTVVVDMCPSPLLQSTANVPHLFPPSTERAFDSCTYLLHSRIWIFRDLPLVGVHAL